uniref:ZnMc domain-containing protein n=1 Tax=Rhabditophanes sp. KR3021 TaxID=114890 RepID=A0AC35TIP1_9BILA
MRQFLVILILLKFVCSAPLIWKEDRNLTWSFRDPYYVFANEFSYQKAKLVLSDAFREWEVATKGLLFTFTDTSPNARHDPENFKSKAKIDILFAKKEHGDEENFDGRNGIIAHAGAKHGKAFIHFDGSERWASDSKVKGRLNLRHVSLHEIGHILSLDHNNRQDSIMNPYYTDFTNNKDKKEDIYLGADDDDVISLMKIYNKL